MGYSIENDLTKFETLVENLQPFLYSEKVYGPSIPNTPRLTVGTLMLHLDRLDRIKANMTAQQQARFRDVRAVYLELRDEWRAHYEQKIAAEAQTRLINLGRFIKEASEDDTAVQRDHYLPEAYRRTVVHFLKNEGEKLRVWTKGLAQDLEAVDSGLRSILDLERDTFLWEEALQYVYPKSVYWWLYHVPENEFEHTV